MHRIRKRRDELTPSASQTLTVLSNEAVARRGMLGLKRTQIIKEECSPKIAFGLNVSTSHKTVCIVYHTTIKHKLEPWKNSDAGLLAFGCNNAEDMSIYINKATCLFVVPAAGEQCPIGWEVATNHFARACLSGGHFCECEYWNQNVANFRPSWKKKCTC